MNKKFSILHFSDLHFGELSVQQMGKYKTSFDDFFYYFLKKVQGIIDDKSTDLVIISGDLTSRGKKKDLHNHFLMKFLDVFIENKVPIITCNGNHDLSREKIELGGQFDFYQEFINENKDRFQCELSKHFDINQISYVFLDSLNCLFFSINSCRNIENRFLDSKNEIHDKDYTDVGIFSAKELDLFLEEIRDKFGNRYHSMNIFLVSHHPMRRFSESIYSIKCLSERNISIVFSGHEHNYEFQENKGILNFVAGSPSVQMEQRTNPVDLRDYLKQFNEYSIDMTNGKVISNQHLFIDGTWESREKDLISIDFIDIQSLEEWVNKNEIDNAKYKKLKELDIISVLVNKSDYIGPKFIFQTKNDEEINGFIVEKFDTQGKVDQIGEWFTMNLDLIKAGKISLRIIDKTNRTRFRSQFPEEFLI